MVSLLAFCCAASSAHGTPRRVVVAGGECKDAELSAQARAFSEVLQARPREDILTASAFSERLAPRPSGSFEDVERRLDAAQEQFYESQYTKVAQGLDELLREVSRLPVGDIRWRLYIRAQLLHALNHRAQGKVKESDAAFRTVLRLAPNHKLDPGYYTPSTRQAFEKLRRELAKSRKVKLAVKSTLPTSEVFLDGLRVGQTPLALEIPSGAYELTLRNGEAVSFPRQLVAQGAEVPVLVDLAYEGVISASPFPCIASRGDEGKLLSHAIRLGGTLGVEEIILVRLERTSSGPKWLAATVVNVEGAQKLREGGFKVQGVEASSESLGALVDFVTTGKPQPNLVVLKPDGQRPWEQASQTTPEPGPEGLDVTAPDPLPEGTARSGPLHPMRIASFVVLGAGVAALGTAGAVRLSAQGDLEALEGHLNASGRIDATDPDGVALVRTLERKGHLITGLLIGSGVALTAGTALFLLSPARSLPPVRLDVSAGTDGASATLSGQF